MGNESSVPALVDLPDDCASASLTNANLKKVPSRLFDLPLLTNLNLSRNSLSSIPEELFADKSLLQTLFLNSNHLRSLPASLRSLSKTLTCLSVQRNQLTEVPEAILSLDVLRELELQDNLISHVGSLKGLKSLQHLNLNRNRLSHIDLEGLTVLTSLNVVANQLVRIPGPLPESLRYICASENKISGALDPNQFLHLRQLDQLMLDDNQISELPKLMTQMTSLSLLDIRKNSILQVDDVWHRVDFFYGDPPSLIIPHLLLGNVSASNHLPLLRHHSVRAVVRAIDKSVQEKNPFDGEFRYLWIDCLDTDEQDMRPFFDPFFEFVDAAINAEETVFVHCRQGKSRSATLVIAYLMHKKKFTLEEALAFCKERRCIVRPNPHFMAQLQQFQDDLLGKQMI